MSRHILDHGSGNGDNTELRRFTELEREGELKGPHTATKDLQKRKPDRAATNPRVKAFLKIDRGSRETP